MKYLTALATLLLSATASPVSKRQTAVATVSNFTASTTVNGDGASISFDFLINEEVNAHCTYSDTTSDTNLPDVSFTTCDDTTVRWQFHQDPSLPGTQGNYRIVVVYTPVPGAASEAGFHEWGPGWFSRELLGGKNETVYVVSTLAFPTLLRRPWAV
ncbi:hypothetical protein F5Y08DRAFT_344995 [Xylaria arbuscula]|nr:hypothetical protein F5Y08DRAFT_344995 [Xylaria arbuscula]